ncbi:MAG: acetyltransferase [Rickettsia endosymbiont of Bryobia graminum]|nr:acetyltransferase [Rickettsia endosymbiont of Bryobia graminum]
MQNNNTNTTVYVHESSYIDDNVKIGNNTKIWHFSHILKDCILGEKVTVGQNVTIGPEVTVGNNCKIQNNVSLYKGIELEDNVFCGPSCVFTNVFNPRAHIERKDEFRKTLIKEGVTIGANATIICGITLGRYALIGAGSVVTKDVKNNALMYGVPARFHGWVSDYGEILKEDLVCPKTGEQYKEVIKDSETYLEKV